MKTLYKFRFTIISLLLFCSVLYFSGCYTSYTTTIEPQQVPEEKEYEFVSLNLKDSTLVDLKDKGAKYFDVFRATPKVIAVNEVDKNSFVFKKDNVKVHPTILKLYKLSEISKVKIEKKEFDQGKSALLTIGIVAGIALFLIALIALSFVSGDSGGWGISF